MVQILENNSFGTQLARALGSGVSHGANRASETISEKAKQLGIKRAEEGSFNNIHKQLMTQAKGFDLDLDPRMTIDLSQKASALINQGVPSSMATSLVLSELIGGGYERKNEKEPRLGIGTGSRGGQDYDTEEYKGPSALKEVGKEALTSIPSGLAKGTVGMRDWISKLPESIATKLLGEKAGQFVGSLAKAGPFGGTPTLEDFEAVINRFQGETPKTPAGRITRNVGELAGGALTGGSASLLSKGALWLLPAGILGQLAEELGFGTTGKLITEIAVLGAPALKNYMTKRSSQKIYGEALKNAAKGSEDVIPEALSKAAEQEASARGFSAADLEKNSPKTRKAMDGILKQFSKEKPSILNERISRVFDQENLADLNVRRAQILEEQSRYANKTKRVQEEIIGERERVAREAQKKSNENAETLAKKAQIRGIAQEQIPMAQQELDQATQLLNKTKDELSLAKKTGESKEVLDNLKQKIERFQAGQNIARDSLRKHHYELKSGKSYQSPSELKNNALNKAETIVEDLKNKSVSEVLKENEMNKLAKEYKNRKTIPGQEALPEDTFVRFRDAAIEAYKEKLEEVKGMLRYASGKEAEFLEKQKEAFSKLIQVNKEQRLVQRRRQGLQDIGKTLLREQKLKGKKLSTPEIEDIIKKTFNLSEEKMNGFFQNAEDKVNETLRKAFGSIGKAYKKFKHSHPVFSERLGKSAGALKHSLKTGELVSGVPRAIHELTTLPLGWSKLIAAGLASGVGGTSIYSGITWGKKILDFYNSLQYKSLSAGDKVLYIRQLKKDGYSAKRIKKIKGE